MKKKDVINKDWKIAYDVLYEEFKSSNHSRARTKQLYKNKELENTHLTARNKYLMRQLTAIRNRIDKILKVEKNVR